MLKMRHKWILVLTFIIFSSGCLTNDVIQGMDNIAFEYIVNNTDLYASGERTTSTNYTANNSALQLFLIFHVVGTGASLAVDTNLSINGTVVQDLDYRTTAASGIHEHFSMTAHIPKGSTYNVTNGSNIETIEWREYAILTGINSTLSVNQYITQAGGGGGVSFDGNPVNGNGSNLYNMTISNYSTLDYTNSSLNLKVNKSGDNMTGKLNISITNGTFSGFTMLGSAGTPFMTYYENSTMRSELTLAGIQIWKVRSTVLDPVGYIVYSTPNDKPGIVFYNSSLSRRINLMARDTGVMLNAGNTSSFKATGLLIDTDDNITVSGLAGAGNDYACLDANGKLFRSNAAC